MQSLTQVPPTMASNLTGFASPPEQPDSTSSPPETEAEAPPKQVALAMDRLSHASRLIANIRIGADRLLEAIFVTAVPRSNKPEHLISEEEASMRRHLQDLRNIGKKLEASGVLNGSLRTRGSPWGLHMPLVCPDGAIVAYSWKRQLAGQAAASAVDRTRLALKAFTDQKRRFFPHLEDDPFGQSSKKLCSSLAIPASHRDEASAGRSLSDILTHLEAEAPNLRIFTYQRLEWLKRVSSMGSFINENSADLSKEQNFNSSNRSRIGTADQVAVLELWVPSVFRVIVSLHPAGSINPDAVAFFSPDEGGKYIHARGFSVYHVFRCITEHADKALQYYLGAKSHASLDLLLHWICGYQTLFTKVCSKCGRLLVMDKPSSLLLPPVYRPYRQSSIGRHSLTQASFSIKDSSSDLTTAYHIGCYPDE